MKSFRSSLLPAIRGLRMMLPLSALLMLGSCSSEVPLMNLGIDDIYYIPRMQKLDLHPALTGKEYRWEMLDPDGKRQLLATTRDYIFLAEKEGTYHLRFEIIDDTTPFEFDFTIDVMHEEIEYSPYITKVYEYCPAPGQFINEMPRYEEGDTYADILRKCEESISGTNDTIISLGGYGGYVTFGFDHTVVNRPGEYDFRIWGNAFYEYHQSGEKGGSAEPGIVMVSFDENCNGIPDDPWYELRGSEYSNPATIHNYSITYSLPDSPDDGKTDSQQTIQWTDSQGNTGFINRNSTHKNSYFPLWIDSETMSFSGSLLPPNAEDVYGNKSYFFLHSYSYGYVDNHPNDLADLNSFRIDDAVDAAGNPVNLPGVDFIRVYTGVNQSCGWLGETSTELCRAQDLHIPLTTPTIPNP